MLKITPLIYNLHIIWGLLTAGIFSLALIQGVVLAFQEKVLRPGGFSYLQWIEVLPPLETMEKLLFQLLRLGFMLLSFICVLSMIYLPVRADERHIFLAILGWIIFAILLLGRRLLGWRGRRAVRLTLIGMCFLLLSYVGTLNIGMM